ncbi:hypothetical protein DLREEDagrD3_16670 [Denitratisoma sp. agr-D3]
MTPSFPIATDNIYKFTCLFGLALIITSIFSLVSTYTSSLDRKVRYAEIVIPLEANTQRNKAEEDLLQMHKKLLNVTKENEKTANTVIGSTLGIGIALSFFGAFAWYKKIQLRDDSLAKLQQDKLELELEKLRIEVKNLKTDQYHRRYQHHRSTLLRRR